MPTDEETLEQIQRRLKDEEAQADDWKKRADRLDREVDPPPSHPDHARDGGVF
jgi:hypothetical protein